MLEICDLRIWFGPSEVVRGVSLTIERGEVLGLVGESGSGKSVTALAILGLLDPSARVTGSIRWLGRELVGLSNEEMRPMRGSQIAMIFQEPMTALNPVMKIGRQLVEAIRAHRPEICRVALRDQAVQALESVAIPDPARRMDDYPHQFSGGQRQRILIAMALVHKPQLLLADEPTTALDVTVQAQILDVLKALQQQCQLAMLFTSHDLAVVRHVASHVAVMRHGEVVECGPVDTVLTTPRHPYTQALLRAVPTMRTDRSKPLAAL